MEQTHRWLTCEIITIKVVWLQMLFSCSSQWQAQKTKNQYISTWIFIVRYLSLFFLELVGVLLPISKELPEQKLMLQML